MEKLLIQISGCLVLFYGIYHVSLRKLTFFEINRWYLLASILFSIAIPLVAPLIELSKPEVFTYHDTEATMVISINTAAQSMTWTEIMWIALKSIYLGGVAIALTRMFIGLYKIRQLYVQGKKRWQGNLHFVYNDKKHLPFSFLGSIYISNQVSLSEKAKEVIMHEEVHVTRGHTFDILFTEVAHAIFWFNPIFIFYKRALKASHEFIADHVVSSASDKYAYIETLVGTAVSGIQLELTNQFFHSQIKKRLEMMNAHTSKKSLLGRYLMAIPLILLLGVVFASAKIYNAPTTSPEIEMMLDTLPSNTKYFIDNKPVSKEEVEKIAPETIKAVNVVKEGGLDEVRITRIPPPPPPSAPKAPSPGIVPAPPAPPSPGMVPAPPAPPAPGMVPAPPAPPVKSSESVFKVVEEMPRFPGCETAELDTKQKEACAKQKMLEYIYKNVKYPATARDNRTQGTAVVQFNIAKNGDVQDINILRDPGDGLGDAAVDVVNSMNKMGQKWTPGKQRGEIFTVQYTLPIKFKLQDDDTAPTQVSAKPQAEGTTIKVEDFDASQGAPKSNTIVIKGTHSDVQPIVFVDGIEIEFPSINTIDPNTIESMTVLKNEKAVELYGSRAKDGVIQITTKTVGKKGTMKGEKLDEIVVVGYGTPKNKEAKPTIEGNVVEVKKIDISEMTPAISISAFPNPIEETVNLEITAKESGKALVELFSVDGSLIKKQNIDVVRGLNNIALELNQKGQGKFAFVKVTQGKAVATHKLIIK